MEAYRKIFNKQREVVMVCQAGKDNFFRKYIVAFILCLFIFIRAFIPTAVLAGEVLVANHKIESYKVQAKAFGMVMPSERKLAPDFTLRKLAPEFTPKDMDGKPLVMGDLKGDLVLLHFWATWCKVCRKEMPMLGELRADMEGKGLRVIGVAVDRGSYAWTKKIVGKFIRKSNIKMDIVLDHDNHVRRLYLVTVLPMTYVIGRDGRFVGKITGARKWNSAESHELFRAMLK